MNAVWVTRAIRKTHQTTWSIGFHIFEAFFTTKQRDGLGLGLSISQRIVQSFGGSLSVRNHPAGGAEFTLRLPLLPTALQPGPVLPSRETAQPGIFE